VNHTLKISTKAVGDRGENLAVDFLIQKGYVLLQRNYRKRYGEVDIIAREGGTLIFCEVKRSRYEGDSHPELRVDRKKQIKITRCARSYLSDDPPAFESIRFDIITVTSRQGRDIIEHIENAFWPPEGWEEE